VKQLDEASIFLCRQRPDGQDSAQLRSVLFIVIIIYYVFGAVASNGATRTK